ncbi:MAG TPA: peptidase M28, partial [Verrucomicrobiae bacterium]|nr:peptidase M28 [Verrucomicrobiae bacterium]
MPVLASRQSKYFAITAIVAATALGVSSFSSPRAQSSPDAGVRSFSRDRLLEHIRKLSSDEFEGRGPGTKGEAVTLAYLEKQFRDAGLEPGNPDRTYLEKVPLVGIRPDPNMELTITGHGTKMHAAFQKDFVAWTKRTVDSVELDADMIFVGYGVQAPEYEWDDFKGV